MQTPGTLLHIYGAQFLEKRGSIIDKAYCHVSVATNTKQNRG